MNALAAAVIAGIVVGACCLTGLLTEARPSVVFGILVFLVAWVIIRAVRTSRARERGEDVTFWVCCWSSDNSSSSGSSTSMGSGGGGSGCLDDVFDC